MHSGKTRAEATKLSVEPFFAVEGHADSHGQLSCDRKYKYVGLHFLKALV